MKVRDIMTREPIVAELPGTRDDVLRILVRDRVSGLPVVHSRTRELAGVVTRGDVFRRPEETQLALVMTPDPITVEPDDDMSVAAGLFFDRRIHTLPVVDGVELVGVLTPTDLLRSIPDDDTIVHDLALRAPSPVHASTPLRAAWEVLRLQHANAAPVLDDDANLAGIVTDSDLFRRGRITEDFRVDGLGNARDDDTWMWDRIRSLLPVWYARSKVDLPPEPVSAVMTRHPVTVYHGASTADAARRMLRHHIHQLPVLDADDRLARMITDLDLMTAAATTRKPARAAAVL